jgi:hypothetical protein
MCSRRPRRWTAPSCSLTRSTAWPLLGEPTLCLLGTPLMLVAVHHAQTVICFLDSLNCRMLSERFSRLKRSS